MENYDYLWKEVIEDLFEDFLLFFAPDLSEQVDFTKDVVYLEQEMRKLQKNDIHGNRVVDKLVKVYLKNGEEKWILIHIEVQSNATAEDEFQQRMFQYFYRIYEKYSRSIYAIALFTDSSPSFKPSSFEYSFYGTTLTYQYNTFKVLEQNEQELLDSHNLFSLAVLAALYMIKSKQDSKKRFEYKIGLVKWIYKLGERYEEDRLRKLSIFMDHILSLPKKEDEQFVTLVDQYMKKEERTMGLSWETTPSARVFRDQGIREGIEKEKVETAKNMIKKDLPLDLIAEITSLPKEKIEALEKEIRENDN